jgi:hypothetical protein
VQAGDSVKMRELSMPLAGAKMAAALGDLPRAYADFGDNLRVVRRGNPGTPDFYVASRRLAACHGGIVILVSPDKKHPRVATFRPAPDMESQADDPCAGFMR